MSIFKTKYRIYRQVTSSAWEEYTPRSSTVTWLVEKRLWWWPFWITMSMYKGEAFDTAVEAFERAKQMGSSRIWRKS